MRRILIADADIAFRQQLRCALSRENVATILEEAVNTREAESKLAAVIPNLLITDISQSEINGFRLIEQVRASVHSDMCRCIIASADNTADNMRRAMRMGVSDYLAKPLSTQDLCELFHESFPASHDGQDIQDTSALIQIIRRRIIENTDHIFKVRELAEQLQITPNYLSALFRKKTGITLTAFQSNIKMEQARKMLLEYPSLKIYEIASMLGYSDEKYFSRVFTHVHHMTPTEYRSVCAFGFISSPV